MFYFQGIEQKKKPQSQKALRFLENELNLFNFFLSAVGF
jgi:hypothetical protein